MTFSWRLETESPDALCKTMSSQNWEFRSYEIVLYFVSTVTTPRTWLNRPRTTDMYVCKLKVTVMNVPGKTRSWCVVQWSVLKQNKNNYKTEANISDHVNLDHHLLGLIVCILVFFRFQIKHKPLHNV